MLERVARSIWRLVCWCIRLYDSVSGCSLVVGSFELDCSYGVVRGRGIRKRGVGRQWRTRREGEREREREERAYRE